MPRTLSLGFALLVAVGAATAGCGSPSVCRQLEQGFGCDDCIGPVTRCSYDGEEATAPSCDGCQARVALLQELCDAGSDASAEEVFAEATCEVVEDTAAEGG